ncbi:MAG: lactate utilization protein [Oscillospiraceae bacterium]|nr:lactate utilization protein [Oscillospiraceae bacterium]
MSAPRELYYEKRGQIMVKNLKSRHFDAWYCANREQALKKALELIPEGAVVGWGGATSAQQIGLLDALNAGNYRTIDRDKCKTMEEREQAARDCFSADVFLTGANGLSLDGQMVNIDGNGNRVGAIIYGPKAVLVIAGMNKVEDTLEAAINRARTVAAPMNQQRFLLKNPCTVTGTCADCKSESCICNQIVITRHCRPAGRIKFVLVGEELGF